MISPQAFLGVIRLPDDMDGAGALQQRAHTARRRGLVCLIREAMVSEALNLDEKLVVARTLSNGELQRQPSRAVVQLEALAMEWDRRNSVVAVIFSLAADACAVGQLQLEDDAEHESLLVEAVAS